MILLADPTPVRPGPVEGLFFKQGLGFDKLGPNGCKL